MLHLGSSNTNDDFGSYSTFGRIPSRIEGMLSGASLQQLCIPDFLQMTWHCSPHTSHIPKHGHDSQEFQYFHCVNLSTEQMRVLLKWREQIPIVRRISHRATGHPSALQHGGKIPAASAAGQFFSTTECQSGGHGAHLDFGFVEEQPQQG